MGEFLDPFGSDDGARLRRIHEALLPLGDLAGLFRDMCVVAVNAAEFAAAPNLVLHDLRELLSAMRDVLDPGPVAGLMPGPAPPRPDLRGELADLLARHGIADDEDVLDRLEGQLEPRSNEADQIGRICAALGLDTGVAAKWVGLQPHKRAHRRRLRVARLDASYRSVFADAIEILDAIADAWSLQWPRMAALIDEAAAAPAPSRDLAKRLSGTLPTNPPVQAALFEQLGAAWVATLRKEGVVLDPPQAVRSGGQIYAVPWPAGAFLARVAADAPREVASVVQGMALTDNPLALAEIARAVARMPLDDARPVLWWLAAALDDTDLLVRGDEVVSAVMRHPLTEPAVVAVARAALRPRSAGQPRAVSVLTGDQHARLAAIVAAGSDPPVTARLLAELLVDLTPDGGGEVTGFWAPDLTAGSGVAHNADARAAITLAALAASERIADIEEALTAFDQVPAPLRHRLRLELVRRRLDEASNAAVAARELAGTADFWVPAVDREWALLADAASSRLTDTGRLSVLGAIGIDPNLPPQVIPPAPQGIGEHQTAWWPHRWLTRAIPTLPLLPEAWQKAVRDASSPGVNPTAVRRWRTSTYRPPSPVDNEGHALPFAELVAAIASRLRELAADSSTPTPEPGRLAFGSVADYADGASADLRTSTVADPPAAVAALPYLLTLPARAARGAIEGLRQATRQGRSVSWRDVAAYADAVVGAGLSDEWSAALHGGDVDAAAADHAELIRGLADVLGSATRRPEEPLSLAFPATADTLPAIAAALERMLNVADPVDTRARGWTPQPDAPPRSIPTIATEALVRVLPEDPSGAASTLQRLLDLARDLPAIRSALSYRLDDIAARYPTWVAAQLHEIFGEMPAATAEDWDPAFAAHLAGPSLPATGFSVALPWYRAAADRLRPEDADDLDSRGSALLGHLARAILADSLVVDDATVVSLLHRGGGIGAALIGEAIGALRETDYDNADAAGRIRSLILAACEATEAEDSAGRRVAAMLGVLADAEVAEALGEDWVLDRLRWAIDRRVALFGAWHVARLLSGQAAAGHSGAGELCASFAGLLSLRDLDTTADLLAWAAAARSDEQWARDVVSVISLHLGPARAAVPVPNTAELS